MASRRVTTDSAPAAVGPYSQGVLSGQLLLVSGQLPIDVTTGQLSHDISLATRTCLYNVSAIVESAGARLQDVIQTTVFLEDMNDFQSMNCEYATFFGDLDTPPSRVCIQVAALPKGACIMISAMARTTA